MLVFQYDVPKEKAMENIERLYKEIKTIPDVLEFCAANYGNKTAFSYFKGKDTLKEVSFSSLKTNADLLCSMLLRLGFANKRIALLGENSIHWIEAFFATQKASSTSVALDKEFSANELEKLIIRSNCAAVFYSKSYLDKVEKLKANLRSVAFICFESFDEIFEHEKKNIIKPEKLPESEDTALIVFTSGTTGDSKGVMLSHKNIISNTLSGCEILGEHKKAVLILPLHHTFGLVTGAIGPMLFCGNVFISGSIRRVQRDMQFFKPDIVLVVPVIAETIYKKILAQAETSGKDKKLKRAISLSKALLKFGIDIRRTLFKDVLSNFGSELNTIICGGAPILKEVVSGLCDLGIETRNGYGITECSPIVSVNLTGKGKNKIGSVGPALSCCKIRITNKDKSGNGEIEVCGSNVMKGYLDDEEATNAAFDGEWFKTGDIGKLDKDGYLYITGRKKNLIILSNGKNVSPEELESKLLAFDAIEEAVVFDGGSNISAEIYPGENGDEEVSKRVFAAIDKFNRSVPPHKNIQKIIIRNEPFPKTATMKIKRYTQKTNAH